LADDITIWGGIISLNGTQTISNLITYNGTINCNTSGTITMVDGRGGLVNFNDNYTPRTITDIDIYKDCTLRVGDHITVTNGITNKGLIQLAGSVST